VSARAWPACRLVVAACALCLASCAARQHWTTEGEEEWRLETARDRGVRQEQLTAQITAADRLVIRADQRSTATTVFESSRKDELRALARAFRIDVDRPAFSSGCMGGPVFQFYAGSRKMAEVALFQGESVRTGVWPSDAYLKDPKVIAAWLRRHGIAEACGGCEGKR
jgi:hypothetical protein